MPKAVYVVLVRLPIDGTHQTKQRREIDASMLKERHISVT